MRRPIMKFETLMSVTTVVLISAIAPPVQVAAENVNSGIGIFDAPGADTTPGSGNGTFPKCVNAEGLITGYYFDSNHVSHGFLRTSGGQFTVFDVPGASGVAGSGFGTFPDAINNTGTITGHYTDTHNVNHGFLRGPSGLYTTFDVPGLNVPAGSGLGTFPRSINDAGFVVGQYTDAHNVNHGFLRSPTGNLTTFDAPGASVSAGSGFGTVPTSTNLRGALVGTLTDASNVTHGFLRVP